MSQSTPYIAVITPFQLKITKIYLQQQFRDADLIYL